MAATENYKFQFRTQLEHNFEPIELNQQFLWTQLNPKNSFIKHFFFFNTGYHVANSSILNTRASTVPLYNYWDRSILILR